MLVSDFDYNLPPELIAQEPARERSSSRLMVLDRAGGGITHAMFNELPGFLRPGDVLVVNDTKVFPARLTGEKAGTGGGVEALLLKDMGQGRYEALVRGRMKDGAPLVFGGRLEARVEADLGGGLKVLRFRDMDGLDEAIEELGRMPLPPYIPQEGRDEAKDRVRYQTVYAKKRGAVAAPTAGLHFTHALLETIKAMGVIVAPVTLHVGVGTFMPVREEIVERHEMHEEEYEVGEETASVVNEAKAGGRRVVAVGTTSARTLEAASGPDGRVKSGLSSTSIYIYPGYKFRVVDALITNFHLPKSTLIMLVCALAGRETVMKAYDEAVRSGYRFYSYGDAMFVI